MKTMLLKRNPKNAREMLAKIIRYRHNAHFFAGIAQLVEQLTCNQKVPSSTLGAGTKLKSAQSTDWADFLCLGNIAYCSVRVGGAS